MKATRDLIIGAFATALLGFAFARIELVEALLGMGRYYQKMEFGPALAAVPALVLVILWFAGQRWREASRLTRQLKRTEARLRQAREKGRSLEDQLGGASRMAAMGALTGGLAHEFNNVLQPIITLAEMNLEPSESQEESRIRTRHILKAAEHGTEVVRGTLAFPAGGTQETEELTPARELAELAAQAQETYRGRIQVEVRTAEEAGTIRVNPTEFRQALTNLLKNAAEAMREGAVTIGLDAVTLDARGRGLPESGARPLSARYRDRRRPRNGPRRGGQGVRALLHHQGGREGHGPGPGGGGQPGPRMERQDLRPVLPRRGNLLRDPGPQVGRGRLSHAQGADRRARRGGAQRPGHPCCGAPDTRSSRPIAARTPWRPSSPRAPRSSSPT